MNKHTPLLQRFKNGWNGFTEHYDLGALPAFLIFLVVVTLGMFLNYLAMRGVIGEIPALLVSGLFEFGILAWKWTSARNRNNDDQDEVVNWATGISVALAMIMLVINLFRTTIENSIKVEPAAGVSFNGWQVAAYITIGLAALTHVIAYLVFDHADTDKKYARQNKRSQNEIAQRSRVANDAILNARADLDIIQKITQDLTDLRSQYTGLPHAQLETVLENARQALLVQYKASALVEAATAALPDIDNSGAVGDEPVSERRSDNRFQDAPSPLRDQVEVMEPSYHPVPLEGRSNNGKKPDPTIRRA